MVVVLGSWVILKNSDIVSADLAAAAVSGGQRLGSSTLPSWYELGFYTSTTSVMLLDSFRVNCNRSSSFIIFVLPGHGGFLEVWCTRSCHSTTELGISKVHNKNIIST